MIVTPEGLNVFPDDVERVLNEVPGVRESRGGGRAEGAIARSACTPCSCSIPGSIPTTIVRRGQRDARRSPEHPTRARRGPAELPRTEGTRKLKRAAIRELGSGRAARPRAPQPAPTRLVEAVSRASRHGRAVDASTTHRRARAQLARAGRADGGARGARSRRRLDEAAFAAARDRRRIFARCVERARRGSRGAAGRSRWSFPSWNRSLAGASRPPRAAVCPLDAAARRGVFAWHHACEGREHLQRLDGPGRVRLQPPEPHGHAGDPGGAACRLALRVAPAMAKEFFKAHFLPGGTLAARVVHEQPELLPRGAVLQRVSAAAARGRRATDAALHRRDPRGRLLGADLPGRRAYRHGRDSDSFARASA